MNCLKTVFFLVCYVIEVGGVETDFCTKIKFAFNVMKFYVLSLEIFFGQVFQVRILVFLW